MITAISLYFSFVLLILFTQVIPTIPEFVDTITKRIRYLLRWFIILTISAPVYTPCLWDRNFIKNLLEEIDAVN